MVFADFGARPSSKFEMACHGHLMVDGMVQVNGYVIHALLVLISTNQQPCFPANTVSTSQQNPKFLKLTPLLQTKLPKSQQEDEQSHHGIQAMIVTPLVPLEPNLMQLVSSSLISRSPYISTMFGGPWSSCPEICHEHYAKSHAFRVKFGAMEQLVMQSDLT